MCRVAAPQTFTHKGGLMIGNASGERRSSRPTKTTVVAEVVLVLCWLLGSWHWTAADDSSQQKVVSPVSAKRSLELFELNPLVKIELVAAEPQVVDPVAVVFDEQGRLWVVEMQDYPVGPPDHGPLRSRIRLLEDRDEDGYFETAHTFADHLLFPTSLLPWKGGVIVTLSGKVVWMKDTNGDGRADVQETWFTGFSEQNPQLRANHPTFGLDNHIYIANGLRGGKVVAVKPEWAGKQQPVSISGMDFRFDPLTGRYEAVSGNGQFGLTFDEWGNRFICSNRNPCRHVVLEDRYVKRNPFLAVRTVLHDVSPPGQASHVFPIAKAWTTSTLHQGQFTAACGVWVYQGTALPKQFYGNVFVCEPTGYLVHRDVLEPHGVTFDSHVGRPGVEFLASRDTWCRPVNLAEGPDGALYVVDMYRAVIEHPDFMPTELKHRPDLYFGNDRGRIYRIVGKGTAADGTTSNGGTNSGQKLPKDLSRLSTARLVELLACHNAWHRVTAARLLYERQDKSVRDLLKQMAMKGAWPVARIRALWALKGLNLLDRHTLEQALTDPSPRVREQAVRLAEPWLRKEPEQMTKLVKQAVEQPNSDIRLLFQAALSLGEAGPQTNTKLLADWGWEGRTDQWVRAAVLSSLPTGQTDGPKVCAFVKQLLQHVAADLSQATTAVPLIEETFNVVGARRQVKEMTEALREIVRLSNSSTHQQSTTTLLLQFAALRGLGNGVRRRGIYPAHLFVQINKQLTAASSAESAHSGPLDQLFKQAAQLASNSNADRNARLEAVSVLQFAPYPIAGPVLKELVQEQEDHELCLSAIRSLSRFSAPDAADALMEDFLSRTPAVRRAVLDAMLTSTARTLELLRRIEQGELSANELDRTRVNRLLKHRDPRVRQLAKKLLAAATPADRQQVIEKYKKALTLKADPYRGREVFQKHCCTCHRIGNLGVDVAPDIADSRTKTPEYLLVSILDPNRAVDNNYFSYTVVTLDGQIYTGIIANETASSVTLKQEEGKTITLLRQDIDVIRSNGVSLMPVGLEKDLSIQDVADVISFIKNWRYLDGTVPLPQFSKKNIKKKQPHHLKQPRNSG